MATFTYRKIGQKLLDELVEKVVASRDSVVLIAPRYGGKRYLMSHLYELLRQEGQAPVLRLDVLQQQAVSGDREFQTWLSQAVREADENYESPAADAPDLFAPLDWLIAHARQPVTLLVSNVDSLSLLLARGLLLKVRTLVEARKLVVALSGEADFQKLVYGPNSEFNCANQYFLQGFDQDLFEAETNKYLNALQLTLAEPQAAQARLFELSGGYLSILKTLVRDIIKNRLNNHLALTLPITTAEIPHTISPDLLRQLPRVINNAPECWEDLRQLLRGDVSYVSAISNTPGPLEVAGVAVRDGWHIRLTSPLLKAFLRGYYTPKRFGDLYVRSDKWDTAFTYYEQLPEAERVRPANADDRREAAFNIKALSAALHMEAAKGTNEVGNLFFKTCRYVLGFREVALLQSNGKEWTPLPIPGCHLDEDVLQELKYLLPTHEPEVGLFPLAGHFAQYVMAAIIPTTRADQFRAVVISDFSADRTIQRERKWLTGQFLEHFVAAYKFAAEIEAARTHLQTRDQHIEVALSILDGLGSRTRDVVPVTRSAAQALRKLGYRRVSFCLVDPERKRIKGVLDESDDHTVDVADMTDYPLNDPKADVQPYVISSRQPFRVVDAAREPLVNPAVRAQAKLTAFAVVPLLNLADEAIGTMHVEREDDLVPTEEEVDDLLQFGRLLAIALGQSERVNLLQSALDKLNESLLIVDSTLHLRYANRKAAELLRVQDGWQVHKGKLLTPADVGKDAMEMIKESLTGLSQRHERRVKLHDNKLGWEALSDAILTHYDTDSVDSRVHWDEQPIGAFLRLRDQTYVYRMFEAFNRVVAAKDTTLALKALLDAARHLGFDWGRLYLIDPEDPDCLVSKDSFGFQDQKMEERFNYGGIRMPRRNSPVKETWACLDDREPLVFYFSPEMQDGSTYTTNKGQEARVVNRPRLQHDLKRKPGDFWVDIPLLQQDRKPLGKFTLEWREDRWPHEFDLLGVLGELASRVLEAAHQREQEEEHLQMVRAQTGQKIMATMAHNIGTQLAALPLLLTRYKLRETQIPELRELNQRLGQIIEENLTIISRAKERLAVVSPQMTRLDLANCLESTLHSYLPQENCEIICASHSFVIEADAHLLKTALFELVQNSKDAAAYGEGLRVRISLSFEKTPEGEQARIVYDDNGPGVPEEYKEKIFEDFFSRHPGRKPGTGLGMGYVRRVVEAHGGSIVECGKAGHGAEFVIQLPTSRSIK